MHAPFSLPRLPPRLQPGLLVPVSEDTDHGAAGSEAVLDQGRVQEPPALSTAGFPYSANFSM